MVSLVLQTNFKILLTAESDLSAKKGQAFYSCQA